MRNRKLSSFELLDACFAKRAASELNATIWLDYEGARKSARKADLAVKKGGRLGLLHGVPMAHKDMFYRKASHARAARASARTSCRG